jgi:hypothetical protein
MHLITSDDQPLAKGQHLPDDGAACLKKKKLRLLPKLLFHRCGAVLSKCPGEHERHLSLL